MINESLRAILGGKERRRLELYDNEKQFLLYQKLLCDDGVGDIDLQMRELHARAEGTVEEEMRKKKRHQALTEASNSQMDGNGSIATIK